MLILIPFHKHNIVQKNFFNVIIKFTKYLHSSADNMIGIKVVWRWLFWNGFIILFGYIFVASILVDLASNPVVLANILVV